MSTDVVERPPRRGRAAMAAVVGLGAVGAVIAAVVVLGGDEATTDPGRTDPTGVAITVVDAGLEDDPDVRDLPDAGVEEPTIDAGVDTRASDDDRSPGANLSGRVADEKRAVTRAMAKRGLRPGDDEELDQLLIAVTTHEQEGQDALALSTLVKARRRAATIAIDKDFIERKLERTQHAVRDLSKGSRKKAQKLIDKAKGQLKKGKVSGAHVYLNRAWKLVPDR